MSAKYYGWIVLAVLCVVLVLPETNAQCAMCKAVAEGSAADEAGYAAGINKGIIYLMFIPYLLVLGLFGFFFRDRIVSFFRDFNNIH